jgi:Raf kinase inhibitor-like YbhB/YbcL family protein
MLHIYLMLLFSAFFQESKFYVTSPAFKHESGIPERYTCDGKDINPQLNISYIPEGTKSMVVLVDDPDAPNGTIDHWVVYNIEPTTVIKENSIPGTQGKNYGGYKYMGPCPPMGMHRYFFKVYALNAKLDLKPGATKMQVQDMMVDKIIESAQLMGTYTKKK